MYKNIMVPVDLGHVDKLGKALTTAADLAKHYGAKITYVGVTGTAPSAAARSPEEYAEKLEAFAQKAGTAAGVGVASRSVHVHDIPVDLNSALRDMVDELGADLVIMASHVPSFGDLLVGSHAGHLASHTASSVFVVR